MAFACLIGTNKSIKTCVQESGLKPRPHNIMFLKVLSIVKLVGIPQAKALSPSRFVLKGIVNPWVFLSEIIGLQLNMVVL